MIKIFVFLFFTVSLLGVSAQELSFKGGHSHNDYHQKKPLSEALGHGMVSVEADIFLHDGKLLVGHSVDELQNNRTLESLYLDPLKELIEEEGQSQFTPIILMVDIKDRGQDTWQELKKVLEKYKDILSGLSDGKITKRSVTIILSGDRPIETLRNEKNRYAFIDGRMNINDIQSPSSLMPLISNNWGVLFRWNGEGEISKIEFEKLKAMVGKCHHNHKIVRFWGISEEPILREEFWKVLIEAGVDLIGCDCPSCLENYLINKDQKNCLRNGNEMD